MEHFWVEGTAEGGLTHVAWRRVWALFQAEGTACVKSPPIGPTGPLLSHHWLVEEAARSSIHSSLLGRPPQPLIPHQAAKFQGPAEGSPPTTAGCIPFQVPSISSLCPPRTFMGHLRCAWLV